MITRPRPAVRPVKPPGSACIRLARPADRPLLEAMHRRCSPASRYHRWHAPLPELPESYLAGVLSGAAAHIALVAVSDRQIVALASAVQHDDVWELGILVEDRYQRRGLGSALLAALLAEMPADSRRQLRVDLLVERAGLLRPLGRLGRVRIDWQDETVHARIELV